MCGIDPHIGESRLLLNPTPLCGLVHPARPMPTRNRPRFWTVSRPDRARCQTGGRILKDRALSQLLKDDWPERLEELEERG